MMMAIYAETCSEELFKALFLKGLNLKKVLHLVQLRTYLEEKVASPIKKPRMRP
jgi:hypothetical protein